MEPPECDVCGNPAVNFVIDERGWVLCEACAAEHAAEHEAGAE